MSLLWLNTSPTTTPELAGRILELVLGSTFRELDAFVRAEYWDYARSELAGIQDGIRQGKISKDSLPLSGLGDLALVLQELRCNPASPLQDIRASVRRVLELDETSCPDQAIFLATRLLFMVNVQTARLRSLTPGTPVVPWQDGSCLATLIHAQFPAADLDITYREGRLHPYFTVANMMRICNLRIQWTDSLADHLRLDRRINTLRVFPYKRSLLQMLEAIDGPRQHAMVLPESVLRETVRSLDMLFPPWDERTEVFLLKEKMTFHRPIEPNASSRTLNLREFVHWRERLLELYDEVFLSPPTSWGQLWADRRSPQQWLTFWLALAIAVLTVISTIATIVQTWASLR